MKRLFCFLSFTCLGMGILNTAYAYTERKMAVMRVMNKAAGKTQTINIPIGQMVEFEKISILVRSCRQTDPFEAENYYAFTEIYKSDGGKIYGNWMNRNNPGDTPLQNPDYDVWVVNCE